MECERILNSDIVRAANLVGAPLGVAGKRRANLVGSGLKHRRLGSRFPAGPAETTVAFQTCCTCCYWTRISFTDLGSHSELCTSWPRDSPFFSSLCLSVCLSICLFLSFFLFLFFFLSVCPSSSSSSSCSFDRFKLNVFHM